MISKILEYIKQHKYVFLTAVLFLLARLILLDQLFLLHDERDIVFSGYSVAKTGHDLFGHFLPISFAGISPDNPLVSIYYSAMWWVALPFRSVFFARLPFVLISTVLVFLVYEIIRHISKDKKLALLSSIIFASSPWVFHVTRLALDLPLAAVTLFGGILFYLKDKRWMAYILFFLTFYNYQGFRVVIPFLIIYLELISHTSGVLSIRAWKKSRMIMNILFITFLFISIAFIDKSVTTKRFGQVVFLSPQRFTQEVNIRRSSSFAPAGVVAMFHNKISVAADYVVDNFIKGQDISYLFKTGDYSPINGNAVGGQFFFMFIAFYYAGIIALGKRMKKEDFYIAGFALLGLLPAMVSVNSATYSIRGFLSTLGYVYLLSLGVVFCLDILKKLSQQYRVVIIGIFILVFAVNAVYFAYNFYLRRSYTVGELFNENERQLTEYLLAHPKNAYTIFHSHPREPYFSYLFLDNSQVFSFTPEQLNSDPYEMYFVGKIRFAKCPAKVIDYTKLKSTIVSESCLDIKTHDKLNDPFYKLEKIPYHDTSTKTAYFIFD